MKKVKVKDIQNKIFWCSVLFSREKKSLKSKVMSVYLIMYWHLCASIDYENSSYTSTLESVYMTIRTYHIATLISLSVHWPFKIARYSNREYIETFLRLRICDNNSSSVIIWKNGKALIHYIVSINRYSKINPKSMKKKLDVYFLLFSSRSNYLFADCITNYWILDV